METWKLSWSKLIGLTVDNVNTYVNPTIEGVYRLSRSEGDKVFVFYVGKGKIKERLLQHISSQEENKCVFRTVRGFSCWFKYSIITNEIVRGAAERRLYKQYLPSCNEVEPSGMDDIEIDLNDRQ